MRTGGQVLGIKLKNGDEYELLYHTAMVRRFESKEPVTPSGPKLEYLFHSVDNRLTTMIGSILLPSKVTSLGLYSDWIKNKDLLAPLWEYVGQIPDKGNKRSRDGSYELVLEDHHLDIPIFKEFRERFAGMKPRISEVYVGSKMDDYQSD